MQIKGPTGPPSVEVQAPSVRSAVPASAATPPATPQVKANTVQLSPSLFQIGQLLEVVVAKVESNALILMLQNPLLDENGQRIQLQLRAPANPQAQPGQQLTVQVKDIQNGIPQLQVVATNTAAVNPSGLLYTAQQQQAPLPPLFANLAQLQQIQSKQQLDALPALVRERMQSLWRSLPDNVQIQKATGLKQALNYSGPYLESNLLKLAQGQTRSYPAMDVQAGLLRLASAIRAQLNATSQTRGETTQNTHTPAASTIAREVAASLALPTLNNSLTSTPSQTKPAAAFTTTSTSPASENKAVQAQMPQAQARAEAVVAQLSPDRLLEQLLHQTEAGLARILTQQLHVAQQDPQRPLWLMELPVRHENGVDVFDLRIQRDAEDQTGAEQAHHTWTVMLAFDLQRLGPVRAQVSLIQDQISTFWWADQTSTVELFHQHLDQLSHRISAAGLKVNKLHCQHGIPTPEQATRNIPISNVMLDEKI